MWLKWLPWRYVLSRVAKSHGFIDPVAVLSRLHRFAQPSEVTEPIELLRAGVVFHARGLINARSIQHNLDWVWPFWIERQFDPHDEAFIPRAFSITHVNLTHRNWTAVGLPDFDQFPIVDPRGLVTPLHDGWSIDTWLVQDDGQHLFPSRAGRAEQRLVLDPALMVVTRVENDVGAITSKVDVIEASDAHVCRVQLRGEISRAGWLVVALRPANPEGVSFIHNVEFVDASRQWIIDDQSFVRFDSLPDRVCASRYHDGDIAARLPDATVKHQQQCEVGLCTAAAMYRLTNAGPKEISVTVPLSTSGVSGAFPKSAYDAKEGLEARHWQSALANCCHIETPDDRINGLFNTALHSLVLHSPGEVYPGPYTYKRFWFRDAAFILHALLVANRYDCVERAIAHFPELQTTFGFFHSQDGEWDSNGAAIWIVDRFRRLSGRTLSPELVHAVEKGAKWIVHKRCSDRLDAPHAGLMPAGFSAEHLGPNDFYYWDDFWSVAGLRAAADIARESNSGSSGRVRSRSNGWETESDHLLAAVDRSLIRTAARRDREGVPASPYRRLDAGAIGSLAASYPLQLWEPDDDRIIATAEFLLDHCTVRGGFFQDMIHSGINAYLTLHLAQVLLRSECDSQQRYVKLLHVVRDLASPTGQWPEAIHPHTGGGCMGDGQHIWAAAEWVLLLRNMFVREEGDCLILASGIPSDWLVAGQRLRFGPTATPFGEVSVELNTDGRTCQIAWSTDWRQPPGRLCVKLPACEPVTADPRVGRIDISIADTICGKSTTHGSHE